MASVCRQVGDFHPNNRQLQQSASASLQLISPGDSQQPLANQSGTTSFILLNELSLHFKDCDVVSSCRETVISTVACVSCVVYGMVILLMIKC